MGWFSEFWWFRFWKVDFSLVLGQVLFGVLIPDMDLLMGLFCPFWFFEYVAFAVLIFVPKSWNFCCVWFNKFCLGILIGFWRSNLDLLMGLFYSVCILGLWFSHWKVELADFRTGFEFLTLEFWYDMIWRLWWFFLGFCMLNFLVYEHVQVVSGASSFEPYMQEKKFTAFGLYCLTWILKFLTFLLFLMYRGWFH